MYKQYLKEREDKNVFEVEGKGFAVYCFQVLDEEKIVYIQDIYVAPKYRNTKIASEIANQICENARKYGCKKLIGSVDLTANMPCRSMEVLIRYGMKPYLNDGQVTYFQKDIN